MKSGKSRNKSKDNGWTGKEITAESTTNQTINDTDAVRGFDDEEIPEEFETPPVPDDGTLAYEKQRDDINDVERPSSAAGVETVAPAVNTAAEDVNTAVDTAAPSTETDTESKTAINAATGSVKQKDVNKEKAADNGPSRPPPSGQTEQTAAAKDVNTAPLGSVSGNIDPAAAAEDVNAATVADKAVDTGPTSGPPAGGPTGRGGGENVMGMNQVTSTGVSEGGEPLIPAAADAKAAADANSPPNGPPPGGPPGDLTEQTAAETVVDPAAVVDTVTPGGPPPGGPPTAAPTKQTAAANTGITSSRPPEGTPPSGPRQDERKRKIVASSPQEKPKDFRDTLEKPFQGIVNSINNTLDKTKKFFGRKKDNETEDKSTAPQQQNQRTREHDDREKAPEKKGMSVGTMAGLALLALLLLIFIGPVGAILITGAAAYLDNKIRNDDHKRDMERYHDRQFANNRAQDNARGQDRGFDPKIISEAIEKGITAGLKDVNSHGKANSIDPAVNTSGQQKIPEGKGK